MITLVKGIGVMAAAVAAAGVFVSLANPQSKSLCVMLGVDCNTSVAPTGDEYTRQIFSGHCRWVYRGDDLIKECQGPTL
jgi:hypothetical protein